MNSVIAIQTTDDLLNISLAGGFLILVLVLVLVLLRLYKILGNVNTVTENIAEITEVAKHYIWQPIQLITKAFGKIKSFFKR